MATLTSHPRNSVPAILAYSGILIGLLYLLFFHLAPDAPMRSTGPPPGTDLLRKVDQIISTAANGRGVEYHVGAAPADWESNGRFFTTAYFGAVYQLYPLRVCVGDGTTIINHPTDLQHADQLPSDLWLHQHHVGSVVTLIPDPTGPQIRVHPIP